MRKILMVLTISFNFFMYFISIYDNTAEVSSEIINARIISGDLSYVTIDKGFYFNIEEGDIVISNNALVGIIDEVKIKTSIVKLITDDKTSVKINNNTYGLIDGYEDGFLIMKGFKNRDIQIGDRVFTTGISYIYSPDIYVGEVYEFDETKILIKTPVDFNNILSATILKR